MARAKPSIIRLCEMEPGQHADFFALLAERTRGATREGKPYFTCRFRDPRRTATFMVWADGGWFDVCERDWVEGRFYKIRATYGEHDRYGPQIDIQNIRPVMDGDDFDPTEYVERSRHDPAEMLAELRSLAETQIADEPLRRLVLSLLDHHAVPLQRAPATLDRFYPFAGGLLEHTLSVTQVCMELVDRYAVYRPELQPPLNRDLVVAGAILHDLGRVAEFDEQGQATVPGRLFGHLFLCRDLVRDAAREQGDVNPELLQLLEHILIAHLNLPEWGSPRLPLIPECLIVHHADDLDAKMEMYVRCLTRDRGAGPFTAREPGLNRPLFKGRKV